MTGTLLTRGFSMSDTHQPLTPAAFEILVSLADGDLHGYAIMQAVERRSAGRVRLRAGTLYRAVERMLGAGWISELDQRPDEDDERRRYYRLTEAGHEVLRAEVSRLEDALAAARHTAALVRTETAR